MAVTDFLFSGAPPPTVSSAGSSSQQLPDWWSQYAIGLLSKANATAGEPYQPSPVTQVAPFSGDQTQAQQMVRDNVGNFVPTLAAANSSLTAGANPALNQSTFDSYKSPYIEGVANRIADLGARNLSEKLLPAVNDTFTGSGQFGSSRNADFTARAVRDANESIMGQQAIALQQAQDSAMTAYGAGQSRAISGGQQLGALGNLQQTLAQKDAAALDTSGQEQQALAQQNANVAQQNFLEQRNWPQTQEAFLNSLIHGLQAPVSTSTASAGPLPGSSYSPSPLATVAGAGLTAASLSKLLGAAKGGYIRRYAHGGLASGGMPTMTSMAKRSGIPHISMLRPPVNNASVTGGLNMMRLVQ